MPRQLHIRRSSRRNREMLNLLVHIERELSLLIKAIHLLQQALQQEDEDAA